MGVFVQDETDVTQDYGNNYTSVSKAFASNVTAGNAIYVAAGCSTSVATPTCADTLSNTYTLKTNTYDATAGQSHLQFYAKNITGGACTPTVSWGATTSYNRLYIGESSGGDTTTLDEGGAAQVQAGGTGTDYYSSGDITTTNAAFLWGSTQNISEASPGTGTLTAGATPAFTLRESGGSGIIAGESLDSQAAGTFDANFTRSVAHRCFTAIMAFKDASAVTIEQEGFRFGVDDGSESAHTWAETQDVNTQQPLSANLLLRALINATADPASIAYKLKYQKNGTGGYVDVPVGASALGTTPLIEAGDCTVSGTNTAGTPWAVSHPAAAIGDLLIFYIAWDNSTSTTDASEPTGPNGETLIEVNATPITDSSAETRAKAWYCVATGSWSATTINFTPSASESWSATVVKVLAGEFDATTPIGATATSAATSTADTTIDSPAFTAGASDGSGRLIWFAGVDTDPVSGTNPTGWTIRQSQDLGFVAHGVATRDAAVTDSESIASATWGIAGDSWTSIAVIVRAPLTTNQIYVATSANIAAGGEATTARLSAPSGKTTGDFVTGRRWDNENGSDSIDVTVNDYTEVEWCLYAQSPAVNTDYFDFRVYNVDTVLDTYTVTPRWTIGAVIIPPYSNLGSIRNRPGRGPYSYGRYFRSPVQIPVVFLVVGATNIVIQDAEHVQISDAPTLTQLHVLVVAESVHSQSSDNVVLTQLHQLSVDESQHGHAADNIIVTQAHVLSVADALHGHAADSLVLTQLHQLAVDEALHGHSVDNVVITQNHLLVISDALHAQAVDNIDLSGSVILFIADAAHAQTVESPGISQQHVLAIADTLHAQSSENPNVNSATNLAIADTLHAHAAEGITITQAHILVVDDALHAHAADALLITQRHTLIISDALHAHLSDNVVMSDNSTPTPDTRIYVIAVEDRTFVVLRENRSYVIEAG